MSRIIDLTSDDDAEPEQSPIDLASPDEDDEDLRLAIALSLQHEIGSARIQPASQKSTENPENHSKQASCLSVAGGIMGMDRKAMEVERLARLKRKREAEGQPPSPSSKRISPPPLPKHKQSQAPAHSASLTRSTGSVPPSNPFSFTKPRVLLTSHPSRHTSRGLEAISFRDIVSPPLFNLKLKSVLAASFIVDFDWVLPHFDTATTKFVFILHAQNDQHRRLLQQDFAGVPNVRLVMPECLGGGGNMHSKIMLLFFNDDNSASGEEICRIVVPSANLIPADWGLGSVMENVAFVVDLPLRGTDLTKDATRFEKEMKKQLRGLGVTEDVLRKLETFNFDATRDTGFVHSMSGSRVVTGSAASVSDKKDFFGLITATVGESQTSQKPQVQNDAKDAASTQYQSDSARTGLLSLHDTIQSLGLSISPDDPTYPPRLDFITSSLGNLSTPFVRQLYQAACGHLDSTAIGSAATTKRTKSVSNNQDSDLDELIKHNLRIYFPTSETVKRSRGGPAAAGTVCFQRKWWETNDLIRDVLCDCVGVRDDGILMHSKILYVRFKQPKPVRASKEQTNWYAGWAYVGSGNLSESAWGRVVGDGKSKRPKMTCRNWESGVVIPVPTGEGGYAGLDVERTTVSGASSHRGGTTGVSTEEVCGGNGHLAKHDGNNLVIPTTPLSLREDFADVLPVPIHYPAQKLAAHQKQPWFFRD